MINDTDDSDFTLISSDKNIKKVDKFLDELRDLLVKERHTKMEIRRMNTLQKNIKKTLKNKDRIKRGNK